jgi:pimeloyl-ACP methyl ester carboxylesterase
MGSHLPAAYRAISINGIDLAYQVEGTGPVPVVLLHGYAASIATWHDLRRLIPPARYTTYLLDLKGFGFSAKPNDTRYSPVDQAALVTGFLESLGLTRAVLIGHSLGGGIALLTAIRLRDQDNERVDRLVLIAAAAYRQPLPPIMRLLARPLAGTLLLTLVPTGIIVRHVLRACFHNQAGITPARIERYARGFSRHGICHAFGESVRRIIPPDYDRLVAAYGTHGVPTLILWGRNDRITPLAMGERLAREIPGARLAVIDDCGHNPHEERPAETWRVIARFLEE